MDSREEICTQPRLLQEKPLHVLEHLSFPSTPHTLGWLWLFIRHHLKWHFFQEVFPDFWVGLDACHRLDPIEADPEVRIHVNMFPGIVDSGAGKWNQRREGGKARAGYQAKSRNLLGNWAQSYQEYLETVSHISELSQSGATFRLLHVSHWLRAAPKNFKHYTHMERSLAT